VREKVNWAYLNPFAFNSVTSDAGLAPYEIASALALADGEPWKPGAG
jgi:hypothetical protein